MVEIKKDYPIGVFDSGLGGLSVLKQCIKFMPHEKFIYYSDSLNAPYGTKSLDEVRRLSFDVVDKLFSMKVKGILVACNTATSAVIRLLREQYPGFPLVGIEPAVKPAALENPGRMVLVLATPRTLKEEKFQYLKREYDDIAKIVKVPCTGLMEFVESGELSGARVDNYFNELFAEYPMERVGAVVLGCTHYPFLRPAIQKIIGDRIKIYDGSVGTAREMRRRIDVAGGLCESDRDARVHFINSATDETMNVIIDENGRIYTECEPDDIYLKRALSMLKTTLT